jgi:hypothetical protein
MRDELLTSLSDSALWSEMRTLRGHKIAEHALRVHLRRKSKQRPAKHMLLLVFVSVFGCVVLAAKINAPFC